MANVTKKTLKDIEISETVVSDVDLSNLSVDVDSELKDSNNPVKNSVLKSKFDQTDEDIAKAKSNIELICKVENVFNRMIILSDKVIFYDRLGTQHDYANIETALNENPTYSGTLTLVEDITFDRTDYIVLTSRNL